MTESKGDLDVIEPVADHVERHIGKIATVLHELYSPDIHLDVNVVEPTMERPYYVLVTSGMSEKPMTVPEDAADGRYAELMICLPKDWPFSQEAFKDERNWWPIRMLKGLARYPHTNETWLYGGHSMIESDPPKPYAPNTAMNSVVLLKPRLFPESAHIIPLGKYKQALLWVAYPLYQNELDLKLEEGSDHLEELFETNGVSELLDVRRASVVKVN